MIGVSDLVGLGLQHLYLFPHEFSGGQCQRISASASPAPSPPIMSVQAQILNLLHDLQQRLGLTYLFITQDLGVVRYVCDRVAASPRPRGRKRPNRNDPRCAHDRLRANAVPDPDSIKQIYVNGDRRNYTI